MWMYTQLKLDIKMKYSSFLDYHINDKDSDKQIFPEYKLFTRIPLYSTSVYFEDQSQPIYKKEWEFYRLKSVWNIKNYNESIEKFIKYIEPLVIEWSWHIWYEEYNKPQYELLICDWIIWQEITDAKIEF